MKKINIYTDGACRGNPGPGGWCAIMVYNGIENVLSGGHANTTNNRMELTAIMEALSVLTEPCDIHVYSDSLYVINGLGKGWAANWKARGWKKADGKDAINVDLWDPTLEMAKKHRIQYTWVKGHNGNFFNERCDKRAVEESQKFS